MLPSDFKCFAWDKIKLGIGRLIGREARQAVVGQWVESTFGRSSLTNLEERVTRVLEEAVELAQSEGLSEEKAKDLVQYVYSRPKGDPAQEAAGVSICVLAYCWAKGFSAEVLEEVELERVLAIPASLFRLRHDRKIVAGVSAPREKE